MILTNQDFFSFCNDNVQSKGDVIVAGHIQQQLVYTLAASDDWSSKDKLIWPVLEQLFREFDWSLGFEHKILIIYNETFTPEIAISLHYWLRTKCTNIQNIYVAVTDNVVSTWWASWLGVMCEKSYRVVEIPHIHGLHYIRRSQPPLKNHSGIVKHFSYWGGTYPARHKGYLLLEMSQYQPWAYLDHLGSVLDKQEIIDYTENITHYLSQDTVDRISARYDRFIVDKKFLSNINDPDQKNEFLDSHDIQWHTDQQCLACVIRETCDSLPFSNYTEKTLRAFWHGCLAIPMSYRAVEALEHQGFLFAHDLFDYSYQNEPDFFTRIQLLKHSLDRFIQQISADDLPHVWQSQQPLIHHNAQQVLRLLDPARIACTID